MWKNIYCWHSYSTASSLSLYELQNPVWSVCASLKDKMINNLSKTWHLSTMLVHALWTSESMGVVLLMRVCVLCKHQQSDYENDSRFVNLTWWRATFLCFWFHWHYFHSSNGAFLHSTLPFHKRNLDTFYVINIICEHAYVMKQWSLVFICFQTGWYLLL